MRDLIERSRPHIALIGECMIELRQQADGAMAQGFGGDTLNAAVYLARLMGEGARVDYVTALGDDSFSDAMCAQWASEGIGLGMVQRLPGRLPGLYCIQTDESGERRFLYWRNEAAVRDCFTASSADAVLARLLSYDVLYLSGITLAVLGETGRERLLEVLQHARSRGAKVVFDNNYRPRLWTDVAQARAAYQALLPMVDLALLTEDDEQALFGHADSEAVFDACRVLGIGEVVLKRGAEECRIEVGGVLLAVPALAVTQVVDTTAAGDSFSAAYLAARLKGLEPEAAAVEGHRLAAQVIQHPGALIPRAAMPV